MTRAPRGPRETQRVCVLVQGSEKGSERGQREMAGWNDARHGRGHEAQQAGEILQNMKWLMSSRVTPSDRILDEAGRPVQQEEEKLLH